METKELIKKWVKLFNEGDPDGLAELYSEEAINHQASDTPVEGRGNIKTMFRNELATANMICMIENIFQDGEWIILEWKDPLVLRGCGFFRITEGKIRFQRGYWDKLSFLRQHNLPLPQNKICAILVSNKLFLNKII